MFGAAQGEGTIAPLVKNFIGRQKNECVKKSSIYEVSFNNISNLIIVPYLFNSILTLLFNVSIHPRIKDLTIN